MKHKIKLTLGEEQVEKIYSGLPFTEDELKINIREYLFKTKVEAEAFKRGVTEAVGWIDCYCEEVSE